MFDRVLNTSLLPTCFLLQVSYIFFVAIVYKKTLDRFQNENICLRYENVNDQKIMSLS